MEQHMLLVKAVANVAWLVLVLDGMTRAACECIDNFAWLHTYWACV